MNKIPPHVAIIMDGNGRWAALRGQPRLAGHKAGAKAVERTIKAAGEMGIKYLTLYAFSTENWARPKTEVAGLMRLLKETLAQLTGRENDDTRLLVSGRREPGPGRKGLPADILKKIDAAAQQTKDNKGLTLNLALNYGARQEITDAVNKLIAAGKKRISEEDITSALYQPALPAPDLIIRTSGDERLSNFLLWQAAYSELYFTPVLWPDFDAKHLKAALANYSQRTRKFGKV